MPHTTEEVDKDISHRTSSSLSITAWWKKFHFSGRVIMCSVLFGLGLVLIGGLVFAINVDDDTSKSNSDKLPEQLPTKPPSKYVGPVIMGVGGFIVTVGVIMCLFETQVCRKKSGDSSPLISEKADPEGKGSDLVPVPSSSQGHKNRRHGKTSASPKKSKSKHDKSHFKEKNQQKSPSARTPPVSIEKSKSFMTSSEEKFLTPPNVIDTALEHNNVENQASSLMKSFTSSVPSWNQSTEFLTPSTSFKDTSISINNSVEVDEKQQQVNFKTIDSEYITPLTVEEDRIQKLLIRVKNEQKEIAKKEMEEKISDISDLGLSSRSENNVAVSSGIQTKIVESDIKMSESAENKNISTDVLPATILDDKTGLNGINPPQSTELKNIDGLKENIRNHEENASLDKCIISNVHAENPTENNKVEKEIFFMENDINEKEKSSKQDDEKRKASPVTDSSTSHLNDSKHESNHHLNKEITDDESKENDLENSVSSDETVVSPDSFVEKTENKENVESTLKENSYTKDHSRPGNILESLDDGKSAANNSNSDLPNMPPSVTKGAEIEVEVNDLSHGESETKVKHTEVLPAGDSS